MDQQSNGEKIHDYLVEFLIVIEIFNRRLERGQPIEQEDLDILSNEFQAYLSKLEPSNIPDQKTFWKIQQLLKEIIEKLEVFLRLVGPDPDDKIGLSEERIAQFNGLTA